MGAFLKFTLSFLILSALSSSSQTYEETNISPTSHLHANPSPSPPPPPLAPPTSYILAVEWAPGFCSQPNIQCKSSFTRDFSIHGLSPSPETTRQVQYDQNAFLPPLKATMAREWPNLLPGINDIFWTEQWLKHGKDQLMSQADYFQQGINLFGQNSAKLLTSLRTRGVSPRPNQLYKRTFIKAALRTVYNADVSIKCGIYLDRRTSLKKQHQQLVEIRIRYSAKFILENNFAKDVGCTDQDILFNI